MFQGQRKKVMRTENVRKTKSYVTKEKILIGKGVTKKF